MNLGEVIKEEKKEVESLMEPYSLGAFNADVGTTNNTECEKIPQELAEELANAQAELQKQRSNWMRTKILYTSLHKVLEDSRAGRNTILEKPQIDELVEKVTQAEVKFCVQKCHSMSQQTKPSGRTEAEKVLLSMIENDIKNTCEQVLTYHDGLNSDTQVSSSTVFAARAMNLGVIIKEEKREVEMCEQELKDAQKTEKQLYSSCMKEMLQSAESMTKVLEKYRIRLQPEIDDKKISNLVLMCESLSLKASSMTMKLQKKVYTPDSIAALQVVRVELMKCKRINHQEIVAIETQLSEYKNLGEEFNAIVSEYNQLKINIEKREWALDKFQQ